MKRVRIRTGRQHGQSGFSLVEILVALTVGLLVTLAAVQLFLGTSRTNRLTEEVSRLQENSRFAVDLFSRSLREAGFVGCGRPGVIAVSNIVDPPEEGELLGDAPVRAMDDVGDDLVIGGQDVEPGTDVLVFSRPGQVSVRLSQTKNDNDAITLSANPGGWTAGDVLVLSDCSAADVFRATSVTSNASGDVTLTHGTSGNTADHLSRTYLLGSDLYAVRSERLFIGRRDGAAVPSIWLSQEGGTALELFEGVEAMEVLLGVDDNNDRTVDRYRTADDVEADNHWSRVMSVRINLLLVSVQDNVLDIPQTIVFNGQTLTTADRRLRQRVSTTIGLRNKMP